MGQASGGGRAGDGGAAEGLRGGREGGGREGGGHQSGGGHEGARCRAYRIVVLLILTPFNRLVRHEWWHADRVPRSGGVIVAANHISNTDPLVIGHFVHGQGRQCHFLAKEQLFRVPLLGWLLRESGQIPVHRGTADAPLALRSAKRALEDGKCVIVYPEGTITKDPGLWPMVGRTGLARLALETGVPVVPVGQWGAQHLFTRRKLLGGPPLMRVAAGEPVDLSAYRGREPTAEVLREATAAVMDAIRAEVVALRQETPPAVPFDPRPTAALPGGTAERRTA